MSYLRSRAEQLSEHLRDCIRQGRLVEPLPGMRVWSQQLGVSRRTLHAALQELQREGWLTVGSRGIRLKAAPVAADQPAGAPRLVRVLFYGPKHPQIHQLLELFAVWHERLLPHGIELRWEKCTPPRLREIARQRTLNELLILVSFSPAYQRLFARSGRPVLILGEVAPGLSLPFVTVDMPSGVRHATLTLLRHGFEQVNLIYADVAAPGTQHILEAFQAACADWPKQPVKGQVIPATFESAALMKMARGFAERIHGRCGVVIVAPVPVGLVMTALLQHGVAVPDQVKIVTVCHPPKAVRLCPPPIHYPFPIERLAKRLTEIVEHFFETRRLPGTGKTIPVEIESAM